MGGYKKRIVFITHRLTRGGAEKMIIFVANSCAKFFDEVILISLYNDKVEFDIDKRIKIFSLPASFEEKEKRNTFSKKIVRYLNLIKLLRNKLKIIKPNIICAFGINDIFISWLAVFGYKTKIVGSERRSPADLPYIWKLISKFVYPRCNGIVFQLPNARAFYNKKVIKKSIIIPNPYTSNENINPCNVELRKKTITAAAARLEHAKGFDILIKAYSLVREKHPDYTLIIYGQGDPYLSYKELIPEEEFSEICFPGLVPDVSRAVYESSVFVLPSRYEGIPNTLLEVMGVGVPTVSCDCPPGGPRFLTKGGRWGLLVPVNDYKLLANSICDIIENKNLSTRLSKLGIQVREELNADIISDKWIRYFNDKI